MNVKHSVTLLALSLGALGSAVLLQLNTSENAEPEFGPRLSIGYYMNEAQLSGTGDDGRILYRARAASAAQDLDDGTVKLREVHVTYDPAREIPWVLRANNGRIPPDGNIIRTQRRRCRPDQGRKRCANDDPHRLSGTGYRDLHCRYPAKGGHRIHEATECSPPGCAHISRKIDCNSSRTSMAISFRKLSVSGFLPTVVAVIGAMPVACARKSPDHGTLQKTLPIALDADASEFDRAGTTNSFFAACALLRALCISKPTTQKPVNSISKTVDGSFPATSSSRISATKAFCDYAEIHFKNIALTMLSCAGSRREFNRFAWRMTSSDQGPAENHGIRPAVRPHSECRTRMPGSVTAQMKCRVTGLPTTSVKEYIIADADESGQVRMKINPPEQRTARDAGSKNRREHSSRREPLQTIQVSARS